MAGIQRGTYSALILIKTVGKRYYEQMNDSLFVQCFFKNFDYMSCCISVCFSSLAVGSKAGYKLFSLNSVEKLEEIYEYGKCLACNLRLG